MSDRGRPSLPRRRNGYTAACEPCRKSKAKCDHAHPICSRCRKRRKPADCFFLDAPMTQAKSPGTSSTQSSPFTHPACRVQISVHHSDENPPASSTHGYLGSTSFSATLHQGDLPGDPESLEKKDSSGNGIQNKIADSNYLQLGFKIIKQLPGEKACHVLLDYYHAAGWPEVSYHSQHSLKTCLTTFWSAFGKNLSDGEIHSVTRKIFDSGLHQVKLDDPQLEWLNPFSGSRTRWETLGTFFTVFVYALLSLPDKEIFACFGRKAHDRQALIAEMKGCVEACITLCRNSLNSMVCHLLYKNMLLETVIHGDASLSVWRLHNDLLGTAVAYGLHVYQEPPKVTIASEMTKRLSGCIFRSDKEVSMFTGRPPFLSRRYYSCPLPLDVSEEALLAGGELLNQELDSLDSNGWNTQGRVFQSTVCRMLVIHGMVMDEVMELFIGTQDQWSNDRLIEIKTRVMRIYSQFPVQFQVSKKDILNCPDDETMWVLSGRYLEYLRTRFLLERLSTEREGASKLELFALAQECLDLVVSIWAQRERRLDSHPYYDYMIICDAMPCIGILCTELLKQVRHPEQVEIKLPVSDIVQNLSLTISFLEWVPPVSGNYKLCCALSKIIRRILDQLFEPATPRISGLGNGQSDLEHIAFDEGPWPLDSVDDFEWLNSVDWTLGQYLNFS